MLNYFIFMFCASGQPLPRLLEQLGDLERDREELGEEEYEEMRADTMEQVVVVYTRSSCTL